MSDNILQDARVTRRLAFLLISILFVINLSGCNTIYRNYIDQKVDSAVEVEKAYATRGEINVILLPGCATEPGEQDTLFSCLKLSRDVDPESVQLPPGEKIYLGHVSEFILRALKHYQFEESFKDFYGHRVVLKFRKLTPQELRARKFTDYSSIAVGTASTAAGVATMMPLGVILFLVDGIKMEFDRQDFEDRVEKMGLPKPKKNIVTQKLESGGRTLLHVKDVVEYEMTGENSERHQFNDKVTSYLVEECLLEKVTPEEMDIYREQNKLFKNK
jgi:hypothetical protein